MKDWNFYCALRLADDRGNMLRRKFLALTSPGLWVLTVHRVIYYNTVHRNLRNPLWWLTRMLETPCHYLCNVLWKSDLLGDCNIEDAVYFSNSGYLTCGARSIGAGSIIHDHVTMGHAVGKGKPGRPVIGRNVWIGPNCIIAGALDVGEGSTLLPGTYLSYSVPPGSVVRGNPGRIICESFDNAVLRATREIVEKIPD